MPIFQKNWQMFHICIWRVEISQDLLHYNQEKLNFMRTGWNENDYFFSSCESKTFLGFNNRPNWHDNMVFNMNKKLLNFTD